MVSSIEMMEEQRQYASWIPKWLVLVVVFLSAFISTFGASITVGSADSIVQSFSAPKNQKPFLISTYLIGCAVGPFLFAPMCERYGRRYAMITGSGLLATFTCASVGAPNWSALLIFRFFAGLGSTAAMCVSGGIIADIVPELATRGMISCWFMVTTTLGPLVASTCSILVNNRWPGRWQISIWVNGGGTLLAFLGILLLPETLQDVKTTNSSSSSLASVKRPKRRSQMDHILLPLRMILSEPIVSVTCLFMSLEYSIFYLFFQLLPVLFTETYGFSTKARVVVFLPVAVGSILAGLMYTILGPNLQRLAESGKYGGNRQPELRRLPPAAFGSLVCVISLFLAGYVVSVQAHYAYLLFIEGAFGTGFLLIFIGLTNYLFDAYKTAIVSALVPSFAIRNFAGAGFQFAAGPLHSNFGAKWELYLLGLLSLPFACLVTGTLYYGPWLRSHSRILQNM